MSQRFTFTACPLSGLYVIQRNPISDERGFFERFFCAEEFKTIGLKKSIDQINRTMTHRQGTVRGLHYQFPPFTETKIVSCLQGRIFDVAVDIRRESPTFLHWHAEVLSSDNTKSLYIPDGYAHGFQTMTDDCEILYLHTTPYQADAEGALHAQDPKLGIHWPLPITELSARDASHLWISDDFSGIAL